MTVNYDSLNESLNGDDGTNLQRFILFTLNDDIYALPLTAIREIIGATVITDLPNAPSYYKGVINLRGRIISVIDLRRRLSAPAPTKDIKDRPFIILEREDFSIGLIVDEVKAIIEFNETQIDMEVVHETHIANDFIVAFANSDVGIVAILDSDGILGIKGQVTAPPPLKSARRNGETVDP